MPGCGTPGEYRAPKSRSTLNDYWWLCLEHVRAYNASWDFYKGMSPGQIEAQLRADASWQRPTWPLGKLGAGHVDEDRLRDHLGDPMADLMGTRARRTAPEIPADLREPLATLGLEWPTTMPLLKTRYKELAKRHHPDTHGGDPAAQERLKVINLAYAMLRSRLVAEQRASAAG
jgi:hypothetical protein